jgi:hypothetical protein
MKTKFPLIFLFPVLFLSGCATNDGRSFSNSNHPGPAAGQLIGGVIGVSGGNVVGFILGTFEGVAEGFNRPFSNDAFVVRHWETQSTSDGRTVRVPVDIRVDAFGRPI